jgi:hypothetical protein
MKKIILSLLLFTSTVVFSQTDTNVKVSQVPDSIILTDGTKISYTEYKKILDKAWNESFGKMSDEEKKLFKGVKIEMVDPKKN